MAAKKRKKQEEILPQKEQKETQIREVVKAVFSKERIITENTDSARELYNQGRYGSLLEDGRVQMSLLEALYLIDKKRMQVYDSKNKHVSFDHILKKAEKDEKNLWAKFCVYRDIRNRGYIIKTALKFGADFRIYDRGVKPGEDHARWVVFPVNESSSLTWHEFSSKNRVAHSTKKRLLIGCVDAENDVTYWEVRWLRP